MKDVAQKVGVSEGTISRWESGDIQNMKRDKIVALAKALKLSPSVIMGWDDNDYKPASSHTYFVSEAQRTYGSKPTGKSAELLKNYESLNDNGRKRLEAYARALAKLEKADGILKEEEQKKK